MDLRLLRYFAAVAETEHMGRAAARLHISQSPLSRQIRALEADLGLTLFVRERQRIRITAAGRWLLEEARLLLEHAERVEREARDRAAGRAGGLSIGFVRGVMWNGVLPAALRRFRRGHPEAGIALHNMSSPAQIAALGSGQIDVGFVHLPGEQEGLRVQCVSAEPLVLALPQGHALARKRNVAMGDLAGEGWLALSREAAPATYERLLGMCAEAGFTARPRWEANSPATLLNLVESGLGAAILPASARRAAPRAVVFREMPWFPYRARTFMVRRSEASSRLIEMFAAGVPEAQGAQPVSD